MLRSTTKDRDGNLERMQSDLKPGDFLVFQLEAGYGLLRLLAVDEGAWHLAAYENLFLDVESAEAAIESSSLRVSLSHAALTQRAFESTQTARIAHRPLDPGELAPVESWAADPNRETSDRSIRLMLGLR